jgi:hypothetical protein
VSCHSSTGGVVTGGIVVGGRVGRFVGFFDGFLIFLVGFRVGFLEGFGSNALPSFMSIEESPTTVTRHKTAIITAIMKGKR